MKLPPGKFFVALGLMFSLWPSSAYSRTWYVRNDGTGDAPTIQAAVDSSGAGDSILVAPGTYDQGGVFINERDSLTMKSEQGPGMTVLLNPNGQILAIWRSSYITIEGFTFENSLGTAIYAYLSAHLILQGNVVRHALESAIALERSTGVMIRGNAIYSNGGGINCMDLSGGIYVYGNTIAHNTSYSGCGFCADDINYTFVNNIIAYNKIGVFSTVGSFSCNDVYGNETNYILLYVPDPTGTNGNTSMPPLFCGVAPATSGNYYLQKGSPCAPGNNPDGPACGLIGLYDVGCGYTAVKKTTWGEIKAIFR